MWRVQQTLMFVIITTTNIDMSQSIACVKQSRAAITVTLINHTSPLVTQKLLVSHSPLETGLLIWLLVENNTNCIDLTVLMKIRNNN